MLKTLTLFLGLRLRRRHSRSFEPCRFSPSPMGRQWSFKSLTGAAPTDTGDPAGRAICMGVVPIRVDITGGEGETAAHPAIGVARGVTAATRRSTEGIRTGLGSLRKAAASSVLFVVMVAVSVKRSMVLFGVRGMAIGAIIRGLSLISVRPAQCIKRRV